VAPPYVRVDIALEGDARLVHAVKR